MRWKASPIALLPPAQAVTVEEHMPRHPNRIAIWAAAMLEIAIGMKNGLTLSKPFSMPRE